MTRRPGATVARPGGSSDAGACVAIERLELAREWPLLRRLASHYADRAKLALSFAAQQDAAERLRVATADYERLLLLIDPDEQADALEAEGVRIYRPYDGPNATMLRDGAAVCSRLASAALEASKARTRDTWPLPA